jgi:hypothetical protein
MTVALGFHFYDSMLDILPSHVMQEHNILYIHTPGHSSVIKSKPLTETQPWFNRY